MCAMSSEQRKEFEKICRKRFENDQKKFDTPENMATYYWGTRGGWIKYDKNPILGGVQTVFIFPNQKLSSPPCLDQIGKGTN